MDTLDFCVAIDDDFSNLNTHLYVQCTIFEYRVILIYETLT